MEIRSFIKRNLCTVVAWASFVPFGLVYIHVFPLSVLTTPDLRVAYACIALAVGIIMIVALNFARELDREGLTDGE